MAALLHPDYRGKKKSITINIERELLGTISTKYNYYLYEHRNRRAPMVILVPGLGGKYNDDSARFIASELYKRGLHIIIISSSFREKFARTISRGVFVGQPHLDAADQLGVLLALKNNITQNASIQITSWNLIGYSYGAATSSFISYYDNVNHQNGSSSFDFKKVVLINPPLDIQYGISKIDEYYNSPINHWFFKGLNLYDFIYDFKEEDKSFYNAPSLFQELGFSDNSLKFFIGRSLKSPLAKIIARTQEYFPSGVFTIGTYQENTSRANRYGFMDYVNTFQRKFYEENSRGRAFWRRYYDTDQFSVSELKRKNDLYRLQNHFRNSS
ncbi:MAG: hypothetical protein HRT44_14265, partial [Bdellovibrionales bacterium]|nr:hypothetical protein [Bdellovibrionales bacterium]NQZ20403.1 hypothetical protein [Bdellovibrionales bacterium]